MRYSNLHTHTVYSDGKQTVEENVIAAIEKNMISLGFSDHSFTDFDSRYCMKEDALPKYFAEIKAAREKYKDKIEVYIGLELDGFSEPVNREDFDYLIGDCHYVNTVDGNLSIDHCKEGYIELVNNYFGGSCVELSKCYFRTYTECVYKHRPDILGHFDLTTKFNLFNEADEEYLRAAKEALHDCLQVTPYIELNVGPISRGLRDTSYPAEYLLDTIRDFGGKMILSSDCHNIPNLIFNFDEEVQILKNKGFKTITLLQNGKFEDVSII